MVSTLTDANGVEVLAGTEYFTDSDALTCGI